jgi:hypothetical protein
MSGNTPKPPTQAGSDFQRYQASAGGFSGPAPGMMMAWAMPPSFAPMPQMPGMAVPTQAAAGGAANLTDSLGTTLQLGIGLVNALLSSTMSALSGAAAMSQGYGEARPWHGHHGGGCECGCGCGCGQDCCDVMGGGCCQPRLCSCC